MIKAKKYKAVQALLTIFEQHPQYLNFYMQTLVEYGHVWRKSLKLVKQYLKHQTLTEQELITVFYIYTTAPITKAYQLKQKWGITVYKLYQDAIAQHTDTPVATPAKKQKNSTKPKVSKKPVIVKHKFPTIELQNKLCSQPDITILHKHWDANRLPQAGPMLIPLPPHLRFIYNISKLGIQPPLQKDFFKENQKSTHTHVPVTRISSLPANHGKMEVIHTPHGLQFKNFPHNVCVITYANPLQKLAVDAVKCPFYSNNPCHIQLFAVQQVEKPQHLNMEDPNNIFLIMYEHNLLAALNVPGNAEVIYTYQFQHTPKLQYQVHNILPTGKTWENPVSVFLRSITKGIYEDIAS